MSESAVIAGIVGFLLGWIIEWVIDHVYFRKRMGMAESSDLQKQNERLQLELGEYKAALMAAKKSSKGKADNDKDDLEVIDGIGPVFERKLYEAGVTTFAMLAELSPAQVREIIKPQNWQKIEPENWIAEAAKLARGA